MYGVYPVLFALRARRRRVLRLWVQERRGREILMRKDVASREEIVERAEEVNGLRITESSKSSMSRMSEGRPHQGFILKCRHLPLELISELPAPRPGDFWVVLDGVEDPANFGSVVRSSAFFKVAGVVVERGSLNVTSEVSKASSGTAEMMPIFRTRDIPSFLEKAREAGWAVLGMDVGGAETLEDWCQRDRPAGGAVLVMGSEGRGLTNAVKDVCDLIKIEGGQSGLDSLNVNVATGVALYRVRTAIGWGPEGPPGGEGKGPEGPESCREGPEGLEGPPEGEGKSLEEQS